jgi:hypothetical protein
MFFVNFGNMKMTVPKIHLTNDEQSYEFSSKAEK